MPRFEFTQGSSSKFWEAELNDAILSTRWGRIGTAGQSKDKHFPSADKAQAEYDKLVREKLREGYVASGESSASVTSEADPASSVESRASVRAPAQVRSEAARGGVSSPVAVLEAPPALPAAAAPEDEGEIVWTPEGRNEISGRRPLPPVQVSLVDLVTRLYNCVEPMLRAYGHEWRKEEPPWTRTFEQFERGLGEMSSEDAVDARAAVDHLRALVEKRPDLPRLSVRQVAMEATWLELNDKSTISAHYGFVYYWNRVLSPLEVLQAVVESWQWRRTNEGPPAVYRLWPVPRHDPANPTSWQLDFVFRGYLGLWCPVRWLLARCTDPEYAEAEAWAASIRDEAPLELRVALDWAFPTRPEWAESDLPACTTPRLPKFAKWLLPSLPREGARVLLQTLAQHDPREIQDVVYDAMDILGIEVGPILVSYQNDAARMEALACIRTPVVARYFAGFPGGRDEHAMCRKVLLAMPRLAIPALLPHAQQEVQKRLLQTLISQHADLLDTLSLSPADQDVLEALRPKTPDVPEATMAELPEVLRIPPKTKGKLPSMPSFWIPTLWPRPLLKGRKAQLPASVLDTLGLLLALSKPEKPWPGLEQVRAACDADSLDQFAWELCSGWLAATAPADSQWALLAVGHLGGDGSARKLTPLIRQWPGEAASSRAYLGLEVLRCIGTDLALMNLHAIAQKVKYKALQDKAQEKIAQIARQRNLTPDDLADRLVPDLGLARDGSTLLNFGPRQFRVGFDETLKPHVTDPQGKKLSDLPKPVQTDDAALADEAVTTWKNLKKDAKALAQDQILRLEQACCQQRTWDAPTFRHLFVEHPVTFHLACRLLWGVFHEDGGLVDTFRLAEDRTLATLEDGVFTLSDAAWVAIPHPLGAPAGLFERWGQVFGDYNILQPFPQLSRPVFTATDIERESSTMDRVNGVTVPFGKVLSLESRGWRRGKALDDGVSQNMLKPLGPTLEASLDLNPGLLNSALHESGNQTLGSVTIRTPGARGSEHKLQVLDPVAFSELVADLTSMK